MFIKDEEVKGARDLQDFTQNNLKYEGKRFEYLVYEDTLYFRLKNVANILGIVNPRTSIDTADERYVRLLTKNGVKMGRNQLFKWFKEKKVLVMHGDEYFPSARYMKMGLFDLEASAISKGNGRKKISHTVKITPKGMKYFMEKIQAKKAQEQIIDFIQLTLFD